MMASRQWWVHALVLWLVFMPARPAFAYLKFGLVVGNDTVTLKWRRTPVSYSVTNSGVPGVTPDAFQA